MEASKTFALHVLDASKIEKDKVYSIIFYLNDQFPEGGVSVRPNLQLTIDVDYEIFLSHILIDQIDYLNQFQHYVLETDTYEPYIAYPNKFQGTCWTGKKTSYNCPGSYESYGSMSIAPYAGAWDYPLVSNASAEEINYAAYLAPGGFSPAPIIGSRVDLEPDFDVYHLSGDEISANCNNCSGQPVLPGQTIRAKLWTEVINADAWDFKRDSSSNSIEGPIWWKIEGKTGWILLDSGEYTISNLSEDNVTVETHSMNVPNYPGDILAMQACVDGDDEIWEESESSSKHKISSPDQGGTTNNCSRIERFYINYPNYIPTGSIESSDCSEVVGWTEDQNTTSALNVYIYSSNPDGSNMQFLSSVVASHEHVNPNGFHGFEWNYPDELKDGISRIFYFHAVNIPEGANLILGSVPLTCAPKVISQSEKAAIQLLLKQ